MRHVNRVVDDIDCAVTVLTIVHFNDPHSRTRVLSVAIHTSVDTNGLSLCGEPQLLKPSDRVTIIRTIVTRLARLIVDLSLIHI